VEHRYEALTGNLLSLNLLLYLFEKATYSVLHNQASANIQTVAQTEPASQPVSQSIAALNTN
jgi:hypothetical protein